MAESEEKKTTEPGDNETTDTKLDGAGGGDDAKAYKERLDKLITERSADKAKAAESKKELDSLRKMQKTYDKFQAEQKTAKDKQLEDQGQFKELLSQQKADALAREQALMGRLQNVSVENAILSAASNAVNPDDVVLAMSEAFSINPETLEPQPDIEALKRRGIDVLDENADQKPLKAIVSEFLAARPHMVKPEVAGGGAGTGPGSPGFKYAPGQTQIPENKADRAELLQQLQKVASGR